MASLFENPIRLLGPGLLCSTLLTACINQKCEEQGSIILPETPLNLTAVNSPYDDWNCAASWSSWTSGHSILFSSSRNSQGRQFDMITQALRLQGEDNVTVESTQAVHALKQIAQRINTDQEELGPSIWTHGRTMPDNQVQSHAAVVFSRGVAPNHDLIALMVEDGAEDSYITDFITDSLVEISLQGLNTPWDEGYPT